MRNSIFFLIVSLFGCAINSGINASVKSHTNKEGLHLVYFNYTPFIEEYTPGWEALREEVAKSDDIETKLSVWQIAIKKAMPLYLGENNLIPIECRHGVEILDSNQDEEGGGVAVFKCIEQ